MRIISERETILEQKFNAENQATQFKIQYEDGTLGDLNWILETSLCDSSALVSGRCIQKLRHQDGRIFIHRYKGLFNFKASPIGIEFLDGEMISTEMSSLSCPQQPIKIAKEGVFKAEILWIGEITFPSVHIHERLCRSSQININRHFDSSVMDANHPFGILSFQRNEGQSFARLSLHAFSTQEAWINDQEFTGRQLMMLIELIERGQDYVMKIKRAVMEGKFRRGEGDLTPPRLIQGEVTSDVYENGRWLQMQRRGIFNKDGLIDNFNGGVATAPAQETKSQILGTKKIFLYGLTGKFTDGFIHIGYKHWMQFHPVKKEEEIFHYFGKFSIKNSDVSSYQSQFDDEQGRLYIVKDANTFHVLFKFKDHHHQNPLQRYEVRVDQYRVTWIKKMTRRTLDSCFEECWRARPTATEFMFEVIRPFKLTAAAQSHERGLCALMMDDLIKICAIDPQNFLWLFQNLSGMGIEFHQSLQYELLRNEEIEQEHLKEVKQLKRSEQRQQKSLKEDQKRHQKFINQQSFYSQQEESRREEIVRERQQQWHSLRDHFFNDKTRLEAASLPRHQFTQTISTPVREKSFFELSRNAADEKILTRLLRDHNLIMRYECQDPGSAPRAITKWISNQLCMLPHHFYLMMHIQDPNTQKFMFLSMIFYQVMRKNHHVQGRVEKSIYEMNQGQVGKLLLAERYEGLFESFADYYEPFWGMPLRLLEGKYFNIHARTMDVHRVDPSHPQTMQYLESSPAIANARPQL